MKSKINILPFLILGLASATMSQTVAISLIYDYVSDFLDEVAVVSILKNNYLF
jgi:hypothetical protein